MISGVVSAQNFTVSGTVKEAGSGELLPGITVYDSATKIGGMTNRYGFYSITLPKGEHSLNFYMMGYKMTTAKVDLKEDKNIEVYLEPASTDIATVEVSGHKSVNESEEVQMSSIDIPIRQIKDIPTFMGEKDVLKTIQLMPGVQSGSEGQSGIYVRGGGPDQNLIILDDAKGHFRRKPLGLGKGCHKAIPQHHDAIALGSNP